MCTRHAATPTPRGRIGSLAASAKLLLLLRTLAVVPPALGLASTGVPAVAAQTPRSVVEAIPLDGTLRLPEAGAAAMVNGAFTGSEPLLPTGAPVRAWAFEARAGERVSATLRSRDFDAVVLIVGGRLGAGLMDDDGGGGTDARLCATLEEGATYRVVASALGEARGSFELALARVTDEAADALCPRDTRADLWEGPVVGTVRAGETMTGALDAEDAAGQLWVLEAPAGRPISVVLRSTEFDAYLMVRGPAEGELYEDDDGAGRCDARIDLTPGEGTYHVRVSSVMGSGGSYELVASEAPPPPSGEPCGAPGGPARSGRAEEAATMVAAGAASPGRVLRVGEERTADLGATDPVFRDGAHAHVWRVAIAESGFLRVEVLSEAIDPYLLVFAGEGTEPYEDDDGAGGLSAGVSVPVVAGGGDLWVVVTSAGAAETGSYRIRVLSVSG